MGRTPTSGVVLDGRFASAEHAKLSWNGLHWELRDLGSKNGTFVDGMRLEPGTPMPLAAGSTIGFGEEAGWLFDDAGPPGAAAVDLETGTLVAGEPDLLALPDEDHPLVSLYPAPEGYRWIAEASDGEPRSVQDGDVIEAGGRRFRVELPKSAEATPTIDVSFSLPNVSLQFRVSADEERVELGVDLRGRVTWLEPREHGYLLLTLARLRREDADQPPAERGWRTVGELSRMLKIDSDAINLLTHRARKQLGSIGLEGAAGIVEVTRGQRRLGTDRFSIERSD